MYILLCFFRVFSFIVYAGYDAKCFLYEETSIVNCSQEFLVHNPRYWVIAWLSIKVVSSIFLVLILCSNGEELNYCGIKSSFKKLKTKGSFWSMNVLFTFSLLYYSLAISNRNKTSNAMSTLILFRLMASVLVVYCLNYLHPVQWPDTGAVRYVLVLWLQRNRISVRPPSSEDLWRNLHVVWYFLYYRFRSRLPVQPPTREDLRRNLGGVWYFLVYWLLYQPRSQPPSREEICRNLHAVCCFLAYWFTLLLYCAENFYMFLAVTLDAIEEVTPITNGMFREEAVQFSPLVAMLLGIKVTLYARIVSFFWNKVFHGNRDLFSEPGEHLPNEGKKKPIPVDSETRKIIHGRIAGPSQQRSTSC